MKMTKTFTLAITLGVLILSASCKKESLIEGPQSQPDADMSMPDNQVDDFSTERGMGCVLMPDAEYAKLEKAEAPSTQSLLSTFSMMCPPIGNQGGEGSCVAWGTCYAARSIMERISTGGSFSYSTNIYSPEFMYNLIKINSSCASGSYVTTALNRLTFLPFMNRGVCTWSMMPYSSTNGCSTMPSSAQYSNAGNHTILGWTAIARNITNFKNYLLGGKPVIVAGPVDTYFQQLGYNQVYSSYNSAQKVGNHCYTVVGWDDSKNAFKVMNSWGTSWGTSGYGWIHYNIMATMFTEAYVINGIL